jgi:quinohemoprotein ethanol dehydrogenase
LRYPAAKRWQLLLVAVSMVACSRSDKNVVDDRALSDVTRGEDWLAFGRTLNEQRFSPLRQIDTSTVGGLKVDWFIDLPDKSGLVSTPLVSNGVLYFIGSMNRVRAVDATSGQLIWMYDPKVTEQAGDRMRVGWDHNRGIALWRDKVILATWDGRLIGVDAATGREQWSTMTVDPTKALYITGAPKVFKDKVIIGNGGTEQGATRGYVTAYDAATGKQAWRFYIVPGNPADGFENAAMEMAAKTWTGEWWKFGGGGNAWHGFTYDAELDRLYIGTGNGSPWNRKIRSPGGGDNLFLSSIVALNPDNGEYIWHYQTAPGESWDYNSNMDIVLADLPLGGRTVKAILHAPKNGFFYVIDRETGKLISADAFTTTTWATSIDSITGRPNENPAARYEHGSAVVIPGPVGGHNWHAMSFNPQTGLAYYPAIHMSYTFSDSGINLATWQSPIWKRGTGTAAASATSGAGSSRADGVTGSLQAWDPVRRKLAWEVPLDGFWNPGTMTSAGNLVFQGRADGNFCRVPCHLGRRTVALQCRLGHLGATDHVFGCGTAIRRATRGLGRRRSRDRWTTHCRSWLGIRRPTSTPDRLLVRRHRRPAALAPASRRESTSCAGIRRQCIACRAGARGIRGTLWRVPWWWSGVGRNHARPARVWRRAL